MNQVPSNHNNLIIIPSTKPTTNMDPFEKPSENSQYVPSLLLSNTMSLAPKNDEIAFTIHQKDIQLALFTETWLKDLIPDDPINISGYHLFRLDRKNKQHSGVCLYVKNIAMKEHLKSSLKLIETLYPNSGIILAGDFNQLDFKSTAKLFNLKPAINFPTRGNNTLDQIFTNLKKFIIQRTVAHRLAYLTMLRLQCSRQNGKIYDPKKGR